MSYRRGKWKILAPSIFVVLITISNFVPDRKTFLMVVAAPTVVESIESGKLGKLDKILDSALDKAAVYLETNK